MAAVLTGTPVALAWGASADPAGQSVTIPADCTAVYFFWGYYFNGTGHGILSATLNGISFAQTLEVSGTTLANAGGVVVWYNPATGVQTLDPAWDALPDSRGAFSFVVFVKDGDTTAWRDAQGQAKDLSTAVSVTLTTSSGDLVIKNDERDTTPPPSLSAGWTNGNTNSGNYFERVSYISATGSTQICDAEDESGSTLIAVSIPAGASVSPAGSGLPPNKIYQRKNFSTGGLAA